MVPDLNTIKAMEKIAWSSGSGSLHLVHESNDDIHKAHEKVGLELLYIPQSSMALLRTIKKTKVKI